MVKNLDFQFGAPNFASEIKSNITMRNLIIILTCLLSVFFSFAEDKPVGTDFRGRGKGGGGGSGSIGRAPLHLPIEVMFDDATGILKVTAPEDLEGSVYVYSVSGALEGYSPTLNATFTLTTPGLHVISLQGENWIGEGKIIL